jgi:hypothetical protein
MPASTVKVKLAPDPVDAGMPAVSVTLQERLAPEADGSMPQETDVTLVPAVTPVAVIPAGNCSEIVAVVPVVAPPSLPSVRTYEKVPPCCTVAVALLAMVKLLEASAAALEATGMLTHVHVPDSEAGRAARQFPPLMK